MAVFGQFYSGQFLVAVLVLHGAFSKPSASPCNKPYAIISKASGWLASPGYDGRTNYAQNLNCTWIFKAPPGKAYSFSFTAFNVEQSVPCIYDNLKITEYYTKDGLPKSTHMATLCGFGKLPDDVTATKQEVRFTFTTDDAVELAGFNVTYHLTLACPDYQWKCGGGDKCIGKSFICDGYEDCRDGSDERLCQKEDKVKCGISTIPQKLTGTRIIGGEISVKGSWPWALSVRDGLQNHRCGATLIDPYWAVTAAHCFPQGFELYTSMAGRHDRNKKDRNEQSRLIEHVFIMKSFHEDETTKRDDIALIQFQHPFTMTDYVTTVCLPTTRIDEGTYGWVVGWGSDFNDQTNDELPCCETKQKQATMPVMNTTLCNQADYYNGQVLTSMMCAGFPEGTPDTCRGDSGGPLLTKRPGKCGQWELQGVTSWGPPEGGCGIPKRPGVYTVVYDYIDWIRRIVADNPVDFAG